MVFWRGKTARWSPLEAEGLALQGHAALYAPVSAQNSWGAENTTCLSTIKLWWWQPWAAVEAVEMGTGLLNRYERSSRRHRSQGTEMWKHNGNSHQGSGSAIQSEHQFLSPTNFHKDWRLAVLVVGGAYFQSLIYNPVKQTFLYIFREFRTFTVQSKHSHNVLSPMTSGDLRGNYA